MFVTTDATETKVRKEKPSGTTIVGDLTLHPPIPKNSEKGKNTTK